MQSDLPGKLSILFASAVTVLAATVLIFASFIYDTQITTGEFDAESTIFVLLCISPFIATSIFLLYFIRRNYPATRVNITARIFFYISVGLTIVLDFLYFLFLLNSMHSTTIMLREKFADIGFLLKFFGIIFVMVMQLFNSIAGIRLIRLINRNNRNEFRNSF